MDHKNAQDSATHIIDIELATVSVIVPQSGTPITQEEVFLAQEAWAMGILEIGSLFLAGGDFVNRARSLIDSLYGYGDGPVLFKPTLAARQPFRITRTEAISYFVGGVVSEDLGFAIRPWQCVRFGEQHVILQGAGATAMGHYYITEYNLPSELKVEFTFGYYRSGDGTVKINLHHSSLPYSLPA